MSANMTISVGDKPREIQTWPVKDSVVLAAPGRPTGDKNWCATVRFSIEKTFGGLERTFWTGGNKGYYAVPEELRPGDFVEVGADKISRREKTEVRHFFRVLERSSVALLVREAGSPNARGRSLEKDLELLAAARRATETPEKIRGEKLTAARELVARLEKDLAEARKSLGELEGGAP